MNIASEGEQSVPDYLGASQNAEVKSHATGPRSNSSGGLTRCSDHANDDGEDGCDDWSNSSRAEESPDGSPVSVRKGFVQDDRQNGLSCLRNDGPAVTVGSTGHPDDCKPCAFYCFSSGCRSGAECAFCHLFHKPKVRKRSQKKRAQPAAPAGQHDETSAPQAFQKSAFPAGMTLTNGVPDCQPPTQKVTAGGHHLQACDKDDVHEKQQIFGDGMSHVAKAKAAVAQLRSLTHNQQDLRSVFGACQESRARTQQHGTHDGPPGLETFVDLVPSALSPTQHQAPMYLHLFHQKQGPLTAAFPHLLQGFDAAMSFQKPSVQLFTYTPCDVMLRIGQMVQLWPPLDLIASDMVFAVSPKLPSGLVLDEHRGLIHGTPDVCTNRCATHFVTARKRGDVSPSVHLSMVSLKVASIP